ncbi:hypothetical protein [Haliscomenobacter sp.]|uniref:hypothetical protein n=1 Tax=Haliscomenobacter sp. TaxID=2717303 RepID=UPI003364BCEE
MKLQELAAPQPSKQIAKVFESYFGSRIRFDQLSHNQTRVMLVKVQGVLKEHRGTTARHRSETNPKYLQLVMMEQALSARLKETMLPPVASTGATAGAPAQPGAIGAAAAPAGAKPPQDPKLAAALKKSAGGQQLNPEEQKLVAGAAMMQAESRLRRAMRRLNESEVQQAQVVLAAQDMVDKMQGMLEDVTELQFKELPALVDSIKNQVGIDQATQFNQDATAALAGLVQNLQGAKQQLDAALNVVTGQAPAGAAAAGAMGADIAAGAGDMAAAGADMAAAGDMGAEMGADAELDAAAAEAGAEPPAAALGRAKR